MEEVQKMEEAQNMEETEEPAPKQEEEADEPAPKRQALDADIQELRDSERRLQRKVAEHHRREMALALELAVTRNENTGMRHMIADLHERLQPEAMQETTLLCDPMVAAEITHLREEVAEAQKRERAAQDELQATQFQAGSIAGKKLVEKCKTLQAENEQLGKDLSEGAVQKLKADIALHKLYESELNKSLEESREWVEHLMDELDTSQGLVFSMKRELNLVKSKLSAEAAAPAAST